MANKKETKTTKKPVEKKTTVKKKVTKKVETKKEEVKVEVKKESKLTKIKDKLKIFFNSSQPLIVVLALMVVALLIYNINYSKHDTVYIGHYLQDNGSIGTIHYFTNHKINLFYATPASFEGDDVDLYAYEIGYYYELGDKLKPFIVRSGMQQEKVSLKKIINDNSYFNISELSTNKAYFTDEAKDNLDKLHFVVYGSTKKDDSKIDYVLDFPIEFDQIV